MATTAEELAEAVARLETGQRAAARAAIVRAWQIQPRGRLARLVELLDEQDDPIHASLAALAATPEKRAREVLAALPADPRVAPALLALVATPPWRSQRALRAWRDACDLLGASGDARVQSRVAALARRDAPGLPGSVAKALRNYLRDAAGRLDSRIAMHSELSPTAARLCVGLEARLRPAPRAPSRRDVLEQAVFAAPDDDGARLVLADHLVQEGDPRGEFMNLQLARAAGTSSDATRARELELVARHGEQWMQPIGVTCAASAFVRGFPAYVELAPGQTSLADAEHPAWATVDEIRLRGVWRGEAFEALQTLLPRVANLRALGNVDAQLLEQLPAAQRAGIERLEPNRPSPAIRDWLATAARPRHLAPHGYLHPFGAGDFDAIIDAPGFARLDTFEMRIATSVIPFWRHRVEQTALRAFLIRYEELMCELTRRDGRLAAARVWSMRWWEPFPVARLTALAEALGGHTSIEIDARRMFVPGLLASHTRRPAGPDTFPAISDGLVDDRWDASRS